MKLKSTLRHLLAALGTATLAVSSASAATLFWDGNDTDTNANGGVGTWDTTATNWDDAPFAGTDTTWDNTNNGTAVFGATAGTVTLGEDITVGGLQIDTNAYLLNTGTNTLTLAPGSSVYLGTGATGATINGNIATTAFNLSSNPIVANTLTLTSIGNGWTGTTTVNAGTTLTFGSTNDNTSAALANSTGIVLNGGTILLNRVGATAGTQVNDSAGITFNGGGSFQLRNQTAVSASDENIGAVTIASGQASLGFANGSSNGGNFMTLASLTRSVNTAAVHFSNANSANVNVRVTGVADTTTGQIIAPWATFGTAIGTQNNYAISTSGDGTLAAANIAGSTEDTWTASTDAYTLDAGSAVALTGTRTIAALKIIGSTADFSLGDFNLETYGVLWGGANANKNILGGGTGILTTPSGGGNLFLTVGQNISHTISANIGDNSGAVTLVRSGTGTLVLSGTNTYTGGTVINSGVLSYNSDDRLGASGSRNVTFGGTGQLTGFNGSSLDTLTVNEGAFGTISGNNITFATTSGAGAVRALSGNATLNLGDASAFTGSIRKDAGGNGGAVQFSALSDAVGAGNLIFGGGSTDSNQRITMRYSGTSALTFDNRAIELLPRPNNWNFRNAILENNSSDSANTWTINTDVINLADRNVEFTLAGSNGGDNEFAGVIGDSTRGTYYSTQVGQLNLYKTGTGRWIVSGENTFTGRVLVNQGTLSVGDFTNSGVAGALGMGSLIQLGGSDRWFNQDNALFSSNNSGALEYTGGTVSSDRTFLIGDTLAAGTGGGSIVNNGTGALTLTAPTLNNTIAGITATRTLTLGGSFMGVNEIQGSIQDNDVAGLLNVTIQGSGIWELSAANTYSGATVINNGGTYRALGSNSSAGVTTIGTGGGTLQLGGTVNGGLASGNLNLNAAPAIVQAINADRSISNSVIVQTNPEFSGDFSIDLTSNLRVNNDNRTLTNTIASGKRLTIASIDRDGANNRNLTHAGTGTTAVTGTIEIGTGTITIDGGTFLINGNATTTGVTTVNAGGMLGGNGSTTGDVILTADGGLAPGDGVGIFTVGGKLDMFTFGAGTGKLAFQLGPVATSDRINVTGQLDIGGLNAETGTLGFSDFNFTNAGGLQAGTYTLMASSDLVGFLDADDLTGTIGSFSAALQLNGNNVELVITSGGASPYETWSGNLAFDADANGDGVSNGLAFLLGASGPNANALPLLPTATETGGGLVLTFQMLNAASRGDATLGIEHSSDLGISDAWTLVGVPDSSGGPTSGVTFTVTPGSPTNTVTATIAPSEAAGGKLFGRLKGVDP